MSCLENVIKLSRTTCTCFDEGKPTDYNEGKADVYLDELEGLELSVVDAISDCASGNLWERMARARENATQRFKADLLACIGQNYTNRRPNYSGLIGDTRFSQTLSFSETKAGVQLRVPRIEGGYLRIRRLGVIMNAVAPITINVYSSADHTTPIGTYTFNSAANAVQYAALTTPLELPLWSNQVNNLYYYLVYDRVGFSPKNNKTDCGCGGAASRPLWKNWFGMVGVRGNNTAYDTFSSSSELNGLVIDGDLYCQNGRLICTEENPLDFVNDGIAMQIAYTIRFKAGELLIDEILSSPEINRFTMMDREALYGKRNRYRSLYEQWIQYLCENTGISNNDCLMCRPNPNIVKGTIRA